MLSAVKTVDTVIASYSNSPNSPKLRMRIHSGTRKHGLSQAEIPTAKLEFPFASLEKESVGILDKECDSDRQPEIARSLPNRK